MPGTNKALFEWLNWTEGETTYYFSVFKKIDLFLIEG